MGSHYVPQAYLRGFESDPGSGEIWMYDRRSREYRHLPIKTVAQEAGFYPADVEAELNNRVEQPANKVLAKLRASNPISEDERIRLGLYIATMIKRVPRNRRRGLDAFPEVLENTISEVKAAFEEVGKQAGARSAVIQRRLDQVEEIRQHYQDEPPEELIDQINIPWPSQKVVTVIALMAWRVVAAPDSDSFVTSDNPSSFFSAFGLAKPESELVFPMSSGVALHGSWQGQLRSTYFCSVRGALIREFNKRVATGAERFVFSGSQLDWIDTVCCKPKPYLSRINW